MDYLNKDILQAVLTRVFSRLGFGVVVTFNPSKEDVIAFTVEWVPWPDEGFDDITYDLRVAGLIVNDTYVYLRTPSPKSVCTENFTIVLSDVDNEIKALLKTIMLSVQADIKQAIQGGGDTE